MKTLAVLIYINIMSLIFSVRNLILHNWNMSVDFTCARAHARTHARARARAHTHTHTHTHTHKYISCKITKC